MFISYSRAGKYEHILEFRGTVANNGVLGVLIFVNLRLP